MAIHASSNIQSLGNRFNDGYTATGGTGGIRVAGRDPLDSTRLGIGRVPSAEYPDGYLGGMRSRRDDKLLGTERSTSRAYSRGVHAGERVPMSAYTWPSDWDPLRGIRNQARGVRTTPVGIGVPSRTLVNDGKANVRYDQAEQMQTIDPSRRQFLKSIAPSWS